MRLTMALNSPSSDIDPADVLRSIGWPAPVSCVVVEGGWDTYIWRLRTPDGRDHALRVYRMAEERDIGEVARREELSLRAVAAAGLPAPDVEASGVYRGLPFFILSWLPGRTVIDVLQTRPWRLWRLGDQFGRLHARLHRVEIDPRLHYGSDAEWIGVVADPAVEDAVRQRAVADAFCHFDFHPVNVLTDGSKMTGVFDFTSSGIADRRADIGRTRAILLAAPIPPSPLKPLLQFLRRQFAATWARGYAKEAGSFPLDPIFEAWGALTFLRNLEEAVAEGRGWGRTQDIEAIRRYAAGRKRAGGIPESSGAAD